MAELPYRVQGFENNPDHQPLTVDFTFDDSTDAGLPTALAAISEALVDVMHGFDLINVVVTHNWTEEHRDDITPA